MTLADRNNALEARFIALQARCKALGYSLCVCPAPTKGDPFYVLGNWASARSLATLGEVENFIKRMEHNTHAIFQN